MLRGCLNKQIAAQLGTVEKTVKVHRGRVMQKLSARSLPDLIRIVNHRQRVTVALHPAELLARVHSDRDVASGEHERKGRSPLPWPLGMWDITNDRVIADPSLARVFGVSEAIAHGGPLSAYLSAIHPEDSRLVAHLIQDAINSGNDYDVTFRINQPDGDQRMVLARGRVEYDRTGRAVRFPECSRCHEIPAALQYWRTGTRSRRFHRGSNGNTPPAGSDSAR